MQNEKSSIERSYHRRNGSALMQKISMLQSYFSFANELTHKPPHNKNYDGKTCEYSKSKDNNREINFFPNSIFMHSFR